jgi:hypothetical protein
LTVGYFTESNSDGPEIKVGERFGNHYIPSFIALVVLCFSLDSVM